MACVCGEGSVQGSWGRHGQEGSAAAGQHKGSVRCSCDAWLETDFLNAVWPPSSLWHPSWQTLCDTPLMRCPEKRIVCPKSRDKSSHQWSPPEPPKCRGW